MNRRHDPHDDPYLRGAGRAAPHNRSPTPQVDQSAVSVWYEPDAAQRLRKGATPGASWRDERRGRHRPLRHSEERSHTAVYVTLHIDDSDSDHRYESRLRRAAIPAPGLVSGTVLTAAPLDGSLFPVLQRDRIGFLAAWGDDDISRNHEMDHPFVRSLRSGWSARFEVTSCTSVGREHYAGLRPSRTQVDLSRYPHPIAVLLVGKLRFRRFLAYRLVSRRVEKELASADGFLWGSWLLRQENGVVACFTLWASYEAAKNFALSSEPLREAIRQNTKRSFFHEGSAALLKPQSAQGCLTGRRNPLPAVLTECMLGPASAR